MLKAGKRVAIIGSGLSGISAAKNAIEHGLSPVVFEKARAPGGNWACSNEPTSIWENLHSNISIYSMCYSDHFYPKNTSIFPSKNDIYNYLLSYIKHFDLKNSIRLETKVQKATRLLNNKWQIESFNKQTNTIDSEVFDFLMIASGLHLHPRIPEFENQENFKGLIMHGSQFALNDPRFKSKRVLVVGCCHSGTEISSHLVDHADCVTNIFNRPYLFARRFIRFKSDKCDKNHFHILPIEMFLNNRAFRPPNSLSKEDKKKYYIHKMSILNREQTDINKSPPDIYFDLEKEIPRVSISDDYFGFVKKGKIKTKKTFIKRFENDGVVFGDNSFEKADVVIFCTGYDIPHEFFDNEIKETLGFSKSDHYKFQNMTYRCTFHPSIPNMAMIFQNEGFTFTSSELQTKWAASVFSGEIELPDKTVMLKEIEKLKKKRALNLNVQYPHGTQADMVDLFAKELGIQHKFEDLKQNNVDLFNKVWNNVTTPCQYRLDLQMSHDILDDIDYLGKQTYKFNDDDDRAEVSIREIAKVFNKNQPNLQVPLHLFKT